MAPETKDVKGLIADMAKRASAAARKVAVLPTDIKDRVLLDTADMIEAERERLQAENRKDLEAGRQKGLSDAFLDRLELSDKVIASMAGGLREVAALEHLELQGLMTMPPFFDQPERARPYFRKLAELARHIESLNIPRVSMRELSMGMSGDFEVAIEEGATLVRVGTAIFGARR